jgi:hypothetical protein
MRVTKGKEKFPTKNTQHGARNIMTTSTMLKQLSLATAGAAMLSFGMGEAAFAFGFTGAYDVTNWEFTNNNADGYVDVSGAPGSIFQMGGNNGSGSFGETLFTTTAVHTAFINFDWDYYTSDAPGFDSFGVVLNDIYTELTDYNASDSYQFKVAKGDTFGFAIKTDDNVFGSGAVTISNFDAQDVPEPITGLVLAAGLGGAALRRAKSKKS